MLTIGGFSNICRVSTKTLRYNAEIGLILPDEINPENGYSYYSINQLEKMLLINRLKACCFSLEEIKSIFESEERMDEVLFTALTKKRKEIYLNGGMWEGKQIISSKWVEDSTIEHSRWKKENLSYGYLWWVNEDGYAAMGDGGNIIYVNTKKKLVISIAALFVLKAGDRIELIKKFIEPVL